MLPVDWILLALWFVGTLRGWQKGLVKQLVSIAGLLLGLMIAKGCYEMLGDVLSPHLGDHTTFANTVSFILIWVAVPLALGLVGELMTTILDKIFVLGTFNRLCGTLVGFLKYTFVLGALVWGLSIVGVIDAKMMKDSVLCAPLKAVPEAVYTAFTASDSEEKC